MAVVCSIRLFMDVTETSALPSKFNQPADIIMMLMIVNHRHDTSVDVRSCQEDYFMFITFITELKIHHYLFYLSFTTATSAIAIPSSMQENVIHELILRASLSMSSRSSLDRALARCSEVMASIPVEDSDFVVFPTVVSCRSFHLYHIYHQA